MFAVDTNVLVYAADADSPAHDRCRARLFEWRAQAEPWYMTWGTVYEFLRVTTHPRVFHNPWTQRDSWSFLEAVLLAPALALLTETDRHPAVLARLIDEVPELTGNLVHDAHTAALMLEHGVRTIYTRDMDFHRFPGIEVRDPLRDD